MAKDEREMLRVPMRKRWRFAGACLVIVGVVGALMPTLLAWEWEKHLPDWALAKWAPIDGALTMENAMPGLISGSASVDPVPLSRRDALYNEAYARLMNGRFSDAAGSVYLQRMQEAGVLDVATRYGVPAAWPWDVPIPKRESASRLSVSVPTSVLLGSHPFKMDYAFEALTGPAKTVRVKTWASAGSRTYTGKSYDAQVDASRGRSMFMTPVKGDHADAVVRGALRLSLHVGSKGVVWIEHERDPMEEEPREVPFYMGLSIRLLRDGKELGMATLGVPPTGFNTTELGATFTTPVTWRDAGTQLGRGELSGIELEVTGDPILGTDTWLMHASATRDTWVGTVRIVPAVEPR